MLQEFVCLACDYRWGPVGVKPLNPDSSWQQCFVVCQACKQPAAIDGIPGRLEFTCAACGGKDHEALRVCPACRAQTAGWQMCMGPISFAPPPTPPKDAPGYRCPGCSEHLGNRADRAAFIAVVRGENEQLLSYWRCARCNAYTLETASAHTHTGETSVTLSGPIATEEGARTVRLISGCPDPTNDGCRCEAHQALNEEQV